MACEAGGLGFAHGQAQSEWDLLFKDVTRLRNELKFVDVYRLADDGIRRTSEEAPKRTWEFTLAKADIAFDMGHYAEAYGLYMQEPDASNNTTFIDLMICCQLLGKPLPAQFRHEQIKSFRESISSEAFDGDEAHFPNNKTPAGRLAELFTMRGEANTYTIYPNVGLQDFKKAQAYASNCAFINHELSFAFLSSNLGDRQENKDNAALYAHKALQESRTDKARDACNELLRKAGHYGRDDIFVKGDVTTRIHHPCDCPICHRFNH